MSKAEIYIVASIKYKFSPVLNTNSIYLPFKSTRLKSDSNSVIVLLQVLYKLTCALNLFVFLFHFTHISKK